MWFEVLCGIGLVMFGGLLGMGIMAMMQLARESGEQE